MTFIHGNRQSGGAQGSPQDMPAVYVHGWLQTSFLIRSCLCSFSYRIVYVPRSPRYEGMNSVTRYYGLQKLPNRLNGNTGEATLLLGSSSARILRSSSRLQSIRRPTVRLLCSVRIVQCYIRTLHGPSALCVYTSLPRSVIKEWSVSGRPPI